MNKPPTSITLFLQYLLTLTFLILLLAGGFWVVEQHGHQQLLAGTGISIGPEQAMQLRDNFNAHQLESIGVVTVIALLAAALIAWYAAQSRSRQLLAEQQSSQQLHRIELLLNSTLEGIYAIDCEGRCIMANRSCTRLLGYDEPTDLLGLQMHDLVHHSHADGSPYPLAECKMHRIVGTGMAVTEHNEVFWRKDGSSLPVAYTAHPIRDKEQIIGIVCTFMDVSEQKQAESQMAQLEDQLRQAQKMEAIGQLASGVAHDFNNILQVISGNAQLLQLHGHLEQEMLASRLSEIVKAVERGITLTRAMLAFARRQAISLRQIELHQLLVETEPLARNLLHKQQQIRLQLHPSPLVVTSDATLLQQVLFNLVTNARDAMPDGGTVTIGTSYNDQSPDQPTDAKTGENGTFAVLWVEDTGLGISEEDRDRVFEPFFTTKEVGKGTGLGLSMVYGTIKQHNGFIQISSEPGRGTKVSVYLPCSPITVEQT